ncbi:MAG TPA: HlyD family type I secretion periplasmic adaptor subunit [Azospirillaceae bacterium]|nr:HlyD family type I secretion periplasmic adaptor subunit [Azospirillaceae bacterium]
MNPTGPIIAGLVTIAITFGGFGVWAALAPLDSAVVAQGVVVVESNRRDVQHLDGGIIAEILVRDGAVVNSGDVLIRLDPTRAHASLAIVRGQLDATRALQARLRAEQSGASQVEFPADLVARAHDPAINDLLRGQEEIFKARRNSINGQTEILRQRIGQFQQQIGGLRAQEQSRDRQIRLIGEELRGTRDLAEKGYAPRTKVLALERETARLEGDRGEHLAALARTQQSIGEAELQILQLTRTFREEVAKSLQEAQNQILELQERETAALDVVRRLEIRAPADGTVVGLAVTTVGAVIAPGRTILQVVPVRDTLLVEAQLQTTDVENVVVGQRGIINFTALQQRTLPNLTGTVLSVSADRLVDERTGTPYFKARLLIDEESLEKIGDRRLVPGMPADVMIATGERTALQYLIDPLSQIVDYAMRER